MKTRGYFLETSIYRHAIFGHSVVKEKITKKISQSSRFSSFFVFMEYKRFICNLIEFYFVLKSSESISEAILVWNEQFKPRKLKDVNFAIAELLTMEGRNQNISVALMNFKATIIRAYIEFQILTRNKYIPNQTKCLLGKKELYRSEIPSDQNFKEFLEYFQDDKSDHCNINDFTRKNRKNIKQIVSCGDKTIKTEDLQKIIDSPTSNSCYRCMVIGDSIIVLEVPNIYTILSFDKAVCVCCKIFNKPCELLPSASSTIKYSLESNPPDFVAEPIVN